ncbi:nucleotidyl transferase AbiEii/AbiGii toxin family protein [Pedobacter frigoris]|uniref:nucleotidyl transferase AbiEii/AbiGii toxin family protein n=1 Tax=Pedobacter frigoris TaxID=2571272 RepID=UPI00292CAE9D|nr:nucleotidyl transferase AbiEii/AbiGii toxin family protein [Pedobacter frigoris]
MMNWNTVNDQLKNILLRLMQEPIFNDFRLVGGTALSLQLGHRKSVDIDLFTDAVYGSVDFNIIEQYMLDNFTYVSTSFGVNPAFGTSYLVGSDKQNAVKADVYYSMDPFFQPAIEVEGVRMASTEEIVAMKIDVIQRGGRKKDFWDLHESMEHYSIDSMLELHRLRYEWTHEREKILENFVDFSIADQDPDPICLKEKEWAFIKEDFEAATNSK